MPPGPSPDPSLGEGLPRLSTEEREALRRVAWESIRHGLDRDSPLEVLPSVYSSALQEPGASFVTLEREGELRGCIGTLEARLPLVEDVARNAFAAAFRDPRFAPLTAPELGGLELHISLLSPPVPLPARTQEELLRELRPGVDGLVLEDPPHRATFLPQVWDALPDPHAFLRQLKLKAGLGAHHWSPTLRFLRYTAEKI